jgi:tetratricopeptide (TPR) repeat protein
MSSTTPQLRPAKLFYSYSHKDEELRDQLQKHLALMKRQGLIEEWHDRRITVGDEWGGQIDQHLQEADVILLLISADFLASSYCYDVEVDQAMRRHETGDAVVIPVVLRPADWHGAPFGKLQALPKDGKPITMWANADEAFENVAQGIRRLIEALQDSSERDIDTRVADLVRDGTDWLAHDEFERAAALFDRAIRLKPGVPKAYFMRGYCRYRLTSYADALGDFMLGRQGESEHKVFLLRASTFFNLKEYEHAKHDCEHAIEADPLAAQGYALRADIHEATGSPRIALASLTQALCLTPRDAKLFRRRADLCAEMGERSRARQDYQLTVEYAEDPMLAEYAKQQHRMLLSDPLEIPDEKISHSLAKLARIRAIDAFAITAKPHALGLKTHEAITDSERIYTWAELTNIFPIEWVEDFATSNEVTVNQTARDRLVYITVTEPDARDPLDDAVIPPRNEKGTLFEDFDEVRHWILDKADASNRSGDIVSALPRIVDALRGREAQGAQQIARIPLTNIGSMPSEVSLTLMFSDLAVFVEDSEHMPEEAKTKPRGEMILPAIRPPHDVGSVVVGRESYLNFELSWVDQYPQLFRDLEPLIQAERVLYLPLPFSTFQHDDREVALRMLGALSWLKPLVRHAVPDDLSRLHPLVAIDLPFISGLGLSDLARVISDEMDRIAEVRMALREAFSTARNLAAESKEPLDRVFRDIIEAKVSALRRSLGRAENMSTLRRKDASVEVASIDVLGLFGNDRPTAEQLKLLFGKIADGYASYLLGTASPSSEGTLDPFHVLLSLANASNPGGVSRPKYDYAGLWKRPLVTARSTTVLQSRQVS